MAKLSLFKNYEACEGLAQYLEDISEKEKLLIDDFE